jgi:hypothetical protein
MHEIYIASGSVTNAPQNCQAKKLSQDHVPFHRSHQNQTSYGDFRFTSLCLVLVSSSTTIDILGSPTTLLTKPPEDDVAPTFHSRHLSRFETLVDREGHLYLVEWTELT